MPVVDLRVICTCYQYQLLIYVLYALATNASQHIKFDYDTNIFEHTYC